ncbi:hypothetical protein DFO50_10617 [Microvirgula sp. AG722]|uniref:hypothetical protein n=1 Tax=Microvirgula sp. AG722 TaxID=2183901 RepID=UPI000DC25EB1|nr:hypothetical protein [Microvirgula sp. AG722]RAS15667.1 hypothetical protein DFO50_10617 [Microvirgula sp. AG722]
MPMPVAGWGGRIAFALAGSLSAAAASGYLLARSLPLSDPLERLYAALFSALALGLLLLCGGLLIRDLRVLAGGLAACLLMLALAVAGH